MIRTLLLFLLPLFLFAEKPMLTRMQMLMGTYATITLPKNSNREISKTFELIGEIEHSLSTYDHTAMLYQLNVTHKVPYDSYLAEALRLSKHYYRDTDGYFDVTIGSISKNLYHFGEEKPLSPDKKALKNAPLNIDGVHIDQAFITTDKNITLDLGGIGKGYAVDKAAAYLSERNITDGIVALSGDIRCIGTCKIYLQSPFTEETFAKVTSKVPDLSVSTSGTYRRYATKKSEHHLIDPKTASQGKAFVSVSLFTRTYNTKIDAYATAVSVMPKAKALQFLKEHNEIGYVLIEPDGNVISGNLETLLDIKM
ncbi:FAD:protein FMN transferase [Sulfurovum sp. NBC37-1]|uniref:FAD:protein FMN transferase n=1 Tax=Sulfurovum sp. (strain NBC37-1) TaxID=387093 RepID=UPI0001587B7B|nr:FAD:protein FMN transferase [Sulfurovum sp. NBC37-1]BAF72807.1 thiamine biosynthesis lipoprotein [Sulfurovum sp. NBC37-1]